MGAVKRIFLSILRRPGKTIILMLVTIIIGSLIAGALLVQQGVSRAESLAKNSLGAAVSVGVDYEEYDKAINAASDEEFPEIGVISVETIETLGTRPEVKNYDYSLDAYASSATLKYYEASTEEQALDEQDSIAIDESNSFTLRGIHYESMLAIEQGALALNDGRTFSKDEISQGSEVAMVSDKFAQLNNLHVGDTIALKNEIIDYSVSDTSFDFEDSEDGLTEEDTEESTDDGLKVIASQDVNLKIIGLFSVTNKGIETTSSDSATNATTMMINGSMFDSEAFNVIYTPISVAKRELDFMTEGYAQLYEEEEIGDYYNNVPIYLLNSADDLASFTEAAKSVLPQFYTVLSAQSSYDQIAAPMNTINQIMTISLIAVIIAGLIIVSLVIVLFLRERRYELGIYFALGERKSVIAGQVIAEVVLIALVALTISIFTGSLLSGALSSFMLDAQMNAQVSSDPYGMAYDNNVYGEQALFIGNIEADEVMSYYSLGLSPQYILMLFGVGLGTVLLSCIVPMIYLLRLNPKQVLM